MAIATCALVVSVSMATAQTPGDSNSPATPSPTAPSIPPDAKTPGQRQPLAGWAAGAGIIIAGAAGFYVYRVIRKGL